MKGRVRKPAGLNSIRVSFHACNNDDDVTAILESLRKLKTNG